MNVPDDPAIPILRRMLDDAKELAGLQEDPVLEGRAPFLIAYVHDMLRLKDPFGTIEYLVDYE